MAIRVFYLDDEEKLCEIFSDLINAKGIEVSTFTNADLAIEEASQKPPDLFFIDFRLPGLTGDAVAHSLDSKIPKVLVTGDISFQSTYEFDHVLPKPYRVKDVINIIESYL